MSAEHKYRPNLTRDDHLRQMASLEPWVEDIMTNNDYVQELRQMVVDFQREAYRRLGVGEQSIEVQEERVKNVFDVKNSPTETLEITAQIANTVHSTRLLNPSSSDAIDSFVNRNLNLGQTDEGIIKSGNSSHEITVDEIKND